MKIVCLNGSPRKKGNSSFISKSFCETAEKNGAEIRTWHLNSLDFRGCQACYACKTEKDRCVLKDDLTEVLEAVRECDLLVLASPVYYGEVTAQTKGFIDRTFSYLTPDFAASSERTRLETGKKLIFILSQGNPSKDNFSDIFPRYSTFFKMMGFEEAEEIRACGVMDIGDAALRQDVMDRTTETAEKVTG